ncbi:MAG TPA: diphosphomevalonate decarboxylase [Anaerolineaceae bacterium]|nr:diphosphomevalonate decarboxylase [Anaerolineaceae bacterium]HQH86603.1 diphosphomevalonate decarboxylase [Anaerolineaceae bacterium]
MTALTATALAHPNIAFIKYWGNRDQVLRLPVNGSISMNLEGLFTRTRVSFDEDLDADILVLNGQDVVGSALSRVSALLDQVREMAGKKLSAQVESSNNFPMGAGIASSAAAFAALSLAASRAIGLELHEAELSRLARLGSGSACRSIPGGFVEWQTGQGDADSFAVSIAPAEHWKLVDCVAVIETGHKPVGSTQGHALADSSPLQAARVADAGRRLNRCRNAILKRDFRALAEVVELDSNLMHAVMMTSTPPLFYWEPASVQLMKAIPAWRSEGLPVCYTLDAGANVHAICPAEAAGQVAEQLSRQPGVQQVLQATVGGPARVED